MSRPASSKKLSEKPNLSPIDSILNCEQLIENMLDGFAMFRTTFDSRGKPTDYIVTRVNKAFGRVTGLDTETLVDRPVAAVFGNDSDNEWLSIFRRVTTTGKASTCLFFSSLLNRFIKASVFRPSPDTIAMTCEDITARLQAEGSVVRQLNFEMSMSIFSQLLIGGDNVDLAHCLSILGRAVDADHVYVLTFNNDATVMELFCNWSMPGKPQQADIDRVWLSADVPWWAAKILANEVISIPDVSAMPAEAATEQQELTERGIKSLLAVPMRSRGKVIGFLGLDDTKSTHEWSNGEEYLLRTAGDSLATYLDRTAFLQELRETQMRFRAVFDCSMDAMVIADDNAFYTEANPAACKLFGVNKETLIGSRMSDYVPDIQNFKTAWKEFIKRGYMREDVRIHRPDGTTRQIECYAVANVLPGRHLATCHDVTEQRAYQEFVNQSNKMQTMGRLAAGIAHDFNNLLQAILGYSSLLSTETGLSDTARYGLQSIEQASRRAAELVQQILAYSRQVPAKIETADLNAITVEALALVAKALPPTITVEHETTLKPAIVSADATQLHQVVMNLCMNARDAMPDGGTLKLEIDQISISRSFVRANPWARVGEFVRLKVTDNGCGMDEETRKRALEPFFTTKTPDGSGLGLATCYGIVSAHSGQIDIKSKPGRGTTVSIYLPAEGISSSKTPTIPAAHTPTRGTETVLLVDDESYIRKFSSQVLISNGYSVVTASNGREALGQISGGEGKIELVILDINMPVMDGMEALAHIRKLEVQPKVLISAGLDTGIDELSPEERPDGFIQKPYSPESLLRAIRRVLDGDSPAKR